MPNILNTNPVFIDTAGAGSVITGKRKIERIIWDNGGSTDITKDDTVVVQDNDGNLIWFCTAPTDDCHINDCIGGIWYDGINVTTLAAGELLIYLTQD
jgi:hypothetical protein